jgi:hypothetical protein
MFRTNDGQVIRAGHSWTNAEGITHPRNWHIWTAEYKANMGITEIVEQSPPDSRFYKWSQNKDGSYDQSEKSLSDVPAVDRDGNAVNDEDGEQIIYDGLKSTWIAQCKTTANTLLAPTDWQVIAKAERDRAIDSGVATYRAAVISACTTIEAAITGAANMAAFKVLFDAPVDGNAPIQDWPDA